MRISWLSRIAVAIFLILLLWSSRSGAVGGAAGTQNGDVNGDGRLDLGDAIYMLEHLFSGGPPPVALADSPELLSRVAAIEERLSSHNDALQHIQMIDVPDGSGGTHRTMRISWANVQIVNGYGEQAVPPGEPPLTSAVNGLGNLIVGYARLRQGAEPNERTGSHNVIVGDGHNYSSHSGIVSGIANCVSRGGASVIGGFENCAQGDYSVVLGGHKNYALGHYSTITGGEGNSTPGNVSSVVGGAANRAWGPRSVVGGGANREARDLDDWVAGELFQDQ